MLRCVYVMKVEMGSDLVLGTFGLEGGPGGTDLCVCVCVCVCVYVCMYTHTHTHTCRPMGFDRRCVCV